MTDPKHNSKRDVISATEVQYNVGVLDELERQIASDDYASTFQSMIQYRKALLATIQALRALGVTEQEGEVSDDELLDILPRLWRLRDGLPLGTTCQDRDICRDAIWLVEHILRGDV